MGSGFRVPETPSKAAGPREPGAAPPRCALVERRPGGENGLRCFLDPRRVGAVVCCPRRVSLCRMQLPEARLGPSVRRGLGAERPSWLKGHGWGWAQKAFARRILLPHEGEPVGSGFRAPETPSKAAGPREPGKSSPDSPYEGGGRGRKRLALLSRSEARGGCGLLPEESFSLQNAAARRLFGAVVATGPRR